MAAESNPMVTGGCILVYFMASITINLFNAFIFNQLRYHFRFPIFAATIYNLFQFVLAAATLFIVDPENNGPMAVFQRLKWRHFFSTVVPCGFAAGLDIALSNYALKYITLSFYTMVKSSSPMFVLIFAFALGLERPSWTLAGIIGVIGGGTMLTVWNAAQFNLAGFVLIFLATALAGVRWSLTQLVIEHNYLTNEEGSLAKSGPLAAMLYLTVVIGASLTLFSMVIEGPVQIARSSHFATLHDAAITLGIGLFGGVLTFVLILAEYKVVADTSVLTLVIAGIVKELIMISLSVVVLGDELHLINYLGVVISICGIGLYNAYRLRAKLRGQRLSETETLRINEAKAIYVAVPTSEPMDPFYFDDGSSPLLLSDLVPIKSRIEECFDTIKKRLADYPQKMPKQYFKNSEPLLNDGLGGLNDDGDCPEEKRAQ